MRIHQYLCLLLLLPTFFGCEPFNLLFQKDNFEDIRYHHHDQEAFNPLDFDSGVVEPITGIKELFFSFSPYLPMQQQKQLIIRLEQYFSEALGVPCHGRMPQTYNASYQLLESENVDFAFVSPYLFVLSEENALPYNGIATSVAHGALTYASYIIVRRHSNLHSLKDLKNKKVAMASPLSASGYLYPQLLLQKSGFNLEKDLKITFSGSHNASLNALLSGRVDAATVSSDTLMQKKLFGINGSVRILAKSESIPFDGVLVKNHLEKNTQSAIRKAILSLSIHSQNGRNVLRDDGLLNGFLPIPKGHYDTLRKAAHLGLEPL